MDIMTHAKFYFNRLTLTLIFAIRASEPPPPPGPGERLKRPGLIGLRVFLLLKNINTFILIKIISFQLEAYGEW